MECPESDSNKVGRREFLFQAGLAAAGEVLLFSSLGNTVLAASESPVTPSYDSWESVRKQFEPEQRSIYLVGFFLASHPRVVREAIERHRRNLDRDPVLYYDDERNEAYLKEVRAAAAEYMGGDPFNIALTDGTTMGLGLLYNGLDLRPGDEILSTLHDHYATNASLDLKARRSGMVIKRIPLYSRLDTVTRDEIIARIMKAITFRTRVLALTWVHNTTGLKIPIREIAGALALVNAKRDEREKVLLCLDGVMGFGVEDTAIPDLGCDFFVSGCHKCLFGPRGTGLIWGKPDAWPKVIPIIPMSGPFLPPKTPGRIMTPGGNHCFEHRWALAEAFRFHLAVGKTRIAGRIHDLCRQMKEGLAGMSHVKLHTPLSEDLSAGIVTFTMNGLKPVEVVERLRKKGIVLTSLANPSCVRLAPSMFNSPEEIDKTLREIKALA